MRIEKMTKDDHHMLCLGVLSSIYHDNLDKAGVKLAVEQAVESAEKVLNMPVSVERLKNNLPICTLTDN